MTLRKGTREKRQDASERKSCAPHGPIMVNASEEGYYVAWCMACGERGPERGDGWEAKLAFDQTVQLSPGGCTRSTQDARLGPGR